MMTSNDTIIKILNDTKTIGLVGASPKPDRPSFGVMRFLQAEGYKVFPVNPGQAGKTINGETVYAALSDIPVPIDMVDIFRRSEEVGPVVDEAIEIGAKSIWMQLGVVNEEAGA